MGLAISALESRLSSGADICHLGCARVGMECIPKHRCELHCCGLSTGGADCGRLVGNKEGFRRGGQEQAGYLRAETARSIIIQLLEARVRLIALGEPVLEESQYEDSPRFQISAE